MSENEPQEEKITDEFRTLGKNLADAARAAWDNPERRRLQSEIETGLSEMRDSLKNEYEHWRESPSAQRLRKDIENLGDRVHSSEAESKIRTELLDALRQVNQELENLAAHWTTPTEGDRASETASESAPINEVSSEAESAEKTDAAGDTPDSSGEEGRHD